MRNERGEKKVFYYKKNKKYAEIMPHTKNKVIEKYTILKTDQVDSGLGNSFNRSSCRSKWNSYD